MTYALFLLSFVHEINYISHVISCQLNELVVGDTSGKLYIYKNDDPKPWITRTCVGMVSNKRMKNDITVVSCHDEHLFKCDVFSQLTCVGVGDVCNKGRVSKKNTVEAVA